ncbi:MAG: hypothetical protein JOZ00_02075 [Mycobacterium sp.]|nr:hypothetical protein [Mycobacterium sp.]
MKSDGTKHPPGCLPEGTRIRIPPSISLESIPGITPFELTVGRALQTYGAILRDSGGATLALSFQEPPAGALNPYAPYGASHDYFDMPHLPWGSVDVVNG